MAIQKISNAVLGSGAVTSDSIATGAITVADIPDGEITTAKIGDNQITNAKMSDNSVNTAELWDGAVETQKIDNLAVTNAKLADDAVTPAKVDSTGDYTVNTVTSKDYILEAINKDLGITSDKQVLIYDTSKDSDGGAWRKKCQHTSWYNETLNTSTRGGRREFPAVAVIVASSTEIRIYDGDDPELPMWMIANQSTNYFRESTISSIAMTEATLAIGCRPYDAYVVNFAKDKVTEVATGRTTSWDYIALRNNTTNPNDFAHDISRESTEAGLKNRYVIDVDVAVLSNAPIDHETGLRIPTVVFAQNDNSSGALSILWPDGETGHVNGYDAPWYNCKFIGDNVIAQRDTQGFYVIPISAIPTGNNTVNENSAVATGRRYQDSFDTYGMYVNHPDLTPQIVETGKEDEFFAGYSAGLTRVAENFVERNKGLVCNTTEEYTSGWMHGDIRMASLASTDTNVDASEIITNGQFVTDVSGWTQEPGTTGTIVNMGGYARVTRGGGSGPSFYQAITTVPGVTYTCQAVLNSVQTRIDFSARDNVFSSGGTTIARGTGPSIGAGAMERNFSFTATGTTTYMYIDVDSNGYYGECDGLSVKVAIADRSYNGATQSQNSNGFAAVGNVTAQPVNTNSELVSYSGWDYTTNTYLKQAYSGKMDWGTSDFCWMGWVKHNGGVGPILGHGDDNNTGFLLDVYNSAGMMYIDAGYLSITNSFARNQSKHGGFMGSSSQHGWNFFVIASIGGTFNVWMNGRKSNDTWTPDSIPDWSSRWASPRTTIGCRSQGGNGNFGSSVIELALIRASATVPTEAQIKKIFDEEFHLFAQGAQHTLYGSSRTINALSYDTVTDELHVGTSSGRSVFKDLQRIDNTTDAVTLSISAVDGMVVEE